MPLRIGSLADLPATVRGLNLPPTSPAAGHQAAVPATQATKQGTGAAAPARKYRNQPIVEDGQRFDSKLEVRCYRELLLRKAAGDVLWFIRQVPFILEGGVVYRADFLAALRAGVEVIDAKGFLTRSTANKIRQVKDRYGVEVQLWRGR